MRIGDVLRDTLYAVGGFILSCGPSQIYGLCKGAVSLVRYTYYQRKFEQLTSLHKALQTEGGKSLADRNIQKLNIPSKWISKQESKDDLSTLLNITEQKQKEIQSKKDTAVRSMKAAGLALVPFVGTHLTVAYQQYKPTISAPLAVVMEDLGKEISAIKKIFFPGARSSYKDSRLFWQIIGAEIKRIDVKGKRQIQAIYVPGTGCQPSDRTVILYHGNGMTASDLFSQAAYYKGLGFNVLVPTMGGKNYEQIETEQTPIQKSEAIETSEISLYQDVDAEMTYLKSLQVTEVGVHGLSIGGAKAFQGALKYGKESPKGYPKVKFVVADQTFTSAEEAAANVGRQQVSASLLGRALGRAAAPAGKVKAGYETDGMDNAKKAEALAGTDVELFAIQATEDSIMGQEPDSETGRYTKNFAVDLLNHRYSAENDKKEANIATVPGGHSTNFTAEAECKKRLADFVQGISWTSGPKKMT